MLKSGLTKVQLNFGLDFHWTKVKKVKWVQSQQKLSPKGLSYIFHANSTDLKSVWLNFGLSMYLPEILV